MTELAVTGWLLLVGSGLFLSGAGAFFWAVMRVPSDRYLGSIDGRPRLWRFANLCLLAGTAVTAAGLWTLPALVDESGANALTVAGAVLFNLAAVLWAMALVHRLTVVPAVASRFVKTGVVDPAAETVDRWAGGLFAAFVVLAAIGLVVIGGGLAIAGPVSSLFGATISVYALIVLVAFVMTGDVPPLLLFLPQLALGIAILASGT